MRATALSTCVFIGLASTVVYAQDHATTYGYFVKNRATRLSSASTRLLRDDAQTLEALKGATPWMEGGKVISPGQELRWCPNEFLAVIYERLWREEKKEADLEKASTYAGRSQKNPLCSRQFHEIVGDDLGQLKARIETDLRAITDTKVAKDVAEVRSLCEKLAGFLNADLSIKGRCEAHVTENPAALKNDLNVKLVTRVVARLKQDWNTLSLTPTPGIDQLSTMDDLVAFMRAADAAERRRQWKAVDRVSKPSAADVAAIQTLKTVDEEWYSDLTSKRRDAVTALAGEEPASDWTPPSTEPDLRWSSDFVEGMESLRAYAAAIQEFSSVADAARSRLRERWQNIVARRMDCAALPELRGLPEGVRAPSLDAAAEFCTAVAGMGESPPSSLAEAVRQVRPALVGFRKIDWAATITDQATKLKNRARVEAPNCASTDDPSLRDVHRAIQVALGASFGTFASLQQLNATIERCAAGRRWPFSDAWTAASKILEGAGGSLNQCVAGSHLTAEHASIDRFRRPTGPDPGSGDAQTALARIHEELKGVMQCGDKSLVEKFRIDPKEVAKRQKHVEDLTKWVNPQKDDPRDLEKLQTKLEETERDLSKLGGDDQDGQTTPEGDGAWGARVASWLSRYDEGMQRGAPLARIDRKIEKLCVAAGLVRLADLLQSNQLPAARLHLNVVSEKCGSKADGGRIDYFRAYIEWKENGAALPLPNDSSLTTFNYDPTFDTVRGRKSHDQPK